MTPVFRPGRRTDLAAVASLFERSFCHTFAHLYRAEDLEAFLAQFGSDAWEQEFDDPRFGLFLAEIGSELVGFVKLGPQALPVETQRIAVELRQIYVDPAWLGRGIAGPLMDWTIAEARRRGADELYLTVYVDNDRALAVYRRYGFVEVGPYAFMVGNHADEDTIMRLTL